VPRGRKKFVMLERLIEEAAGVPAQVDHEARGALGLQAAERLRELARGGLVELLDGDVRGLASSIRANGMAGMRMVRRVNSTSNGWATPGRWKRAFTRVPGTPLRPLETWSMRHPRVDCVSTPTMRSPSRMPASSAGRVRIDLADHDGPFVVLDQHADAAVEAAGGRR
jgi:hypothetical protein